MSFIIRRLLLMSEQYPLRRLAVPCLTAFLLCGCGVSLFDSPAPEPQVKTIQVPELYCPAIQTIDRPQPIEQPAPDFMVVAEGDPRLTGVALVCLDSDGYQELAEFFEAVIIFAKDTGASLRYYEEAINKQKQEN